MKTDFKKSLPSYKAKPGQFDIIDVPPMNFLMISGGGGPTSTAYAEAIQTLYPVAYTLKFASKQELQKDYVVPPLEALWWADDWEVFTTKFDQSQWLWTAMLMVPTWITDALFRAALEKVAKKSNPPSLDRIRLETLHEGTSVQTLHLGPYSNEGPTLKQMHEQFIPENGLKMHGKHHEIYFNDFRKTAPEKLRTILRQQVARVEEN